MAKPSEPIAQISDLKAQAARAKAQLDALDKEIAEDPTMILKPEIVRARQMYSAEWRACLDLTRKMGAGGTSKKEAGGRLSAIRDNVISMTG